MKKKRTDKERFDYIEERLTTYKKPVIFWPDTEPFLDGYYPTSSEESARDCVDFLITKQEEFDDHFFTDLARKLSDSAISIKKKKKKG